eukprot:TRINITY_DN31069_c0_g1_i1.p1 TRINITY_DN31069_c0_g1~~TRINITY_DN31069_c0_g1_i1.p1  ORF type:complete len:702 (+),score=119.04 TRINITY_DN31069_c0_g1_i1:273-2378(+)
MRCFRAICSELFRCNCLFNRANAWAKPKAIHWFSTGGNGKMPPGYSFLQPAIFSVLNRPRRLLLNRDRRPAQPKDELKKDSPEFSILEGDLERALSQKNITESWKAFKLLKTKGCLPSKPLLNQLISELIDAGDVPSVKRAFVTVLLLLEKHSDRKLLEMNTLVKLINRLSTDNLMSPVVVIVTKLFRSSIYLPLSLWRSLLERMAKETSTAPLAIEIFMEICRICQETTYGKENPLKPDTRAANAAMNACLTLGLVDQAEEVLKMFDALDLRPDGESFGMLAQIYAKVGLKEKILRLSGLMKQYKMVPDYQFYSNLVSGYLKLRDWESASDIVLQMLRRSYENSQKEKFLDVQVSDDGAVVLPDKELYNKLIEGFIEIGTVKGLATFIIRVQELEGHLVKEKQISGASIMDSLISLGHIDKARSVLDEMKDGKAKAGIDIYLSLLKVYCKEKNTAEVTQIVSELSNDGHVLDACSYDAVIDVCMQAEDFKAAFSLFREMQQAEINSRNTAYLTIMTGLMESRRPELMAAFLDEVVGDPCVKVGIHDWNSIIHSFCKLGRLDDARRTLKRMIFLRYEPNEQSYLSLVHAYCSIEKYFSVLLLWRELRNRIARALSKGIEPPKIGYALLDAFLYAMVKGGFFEAAMEIVHEMQELKIFTDKWRYKQVFMEVDKKLRSPKMRKRNFRKVQAILAFKNWLGLTS